MSLHGGGAAYPVSALPQGQGAALAFSHGVGTLTPGLDFCICLFAGECHCVLGLQK